MQKYIYKITISFLVISLFFSCQKHYKIERGIYSLEEMKTLLPDDVNLMTMDDEKYIQFVNPVERDEYVDNRFRLSAYGNTVAIAWPNLQTIIDEKTLYDGRIDMYEYNPDKNKIILEQQIYPPVVKEYIKEGDYYNIGDDYRTLSDNIKLYKDQMLVNAGDYTNARKISGFENITDKKKILNKIKQMDDVFSDKVYLYKRSGNNWVLDQEFNPELEDNEKIVEVSADGIGLHYPAYFGSILNINNDYCLIREKQITKSIYLYKKNNDGFFKQSAVYPAGKGPWKPTSMSDYFSIWAKDLYFDSKVIIINNETTKIESVIKSPLFPDNESFGNSVAITENMAFISESLYGSGYISSSKGTETFDGSFPGYVHIYSRSDKGKWELAQTLTSPFGTHHEVFGIHIIANEKYLVITSQPVYKQGGSSKNQPGLAYIYKKQTDNSFKLEKMLIGRPESIENKTFAFYKYLSFFRDGLIFNLNNKTIRFIPSLFEMEQ